MRPILTPSTNAVFQLRGGTRKNDLPLFRTKENGQSLLISTWELEDHERKAIAEGATLELVIWGTGQPPVALGIGPSIENMEGYEKMREDSI